MSVEERSDKILKLINELKDLPFKNLDKYEVGDFIDEFITYSVVECPVCGNKTLDSWYVCPHCGWEYDYTSNYDEYSDANGSTLREYIEAYDNLVSNGDV